MANRANAASVGAGIATGMQKYQSALNIIRTDVTRSKQAQSKAGGEAGQAWTRIEKIGVNKKGAQMAAAVLAMEEASSQDVIRTFVNILACAGRIPEPDLMDLAEKLSKGEVEFSRGGDGSQDEDDDGDDGDEDTDGETGEGGPDEGDEDDGEEGDAEEEPEPVAATAEKPKAKPRAGRLTPGEAREAAKKHLSIVD